MSLEGRPEREREGYFTGKVFFVGGRTENQRSLPAGDKGAAWRTEKGGPQGKGGSHSTRTAR